MAKRLLKCYYCGQTFDANKEPFVKVNSRRYAHEACALGADKEQKDKEELINYIKLLFGISSISVKIEKQIETYHEKNKYTYSGIHKTLIYFFDVRGNSIEKANGGIGIVPYVYEDARKYWIAIQEAKDKNNSIDTSKYILPIKEIHIIPPKRQPLKHLRRQFTFLDDEVTYEE